MPCGVRCSGVAYVCFREAGSGWRCAICLVFTKLAVRAFPVAGPSGNSFAGQARLRAEAPLAHTRRRLRIANLPDYACICRCVPRRCAFDDESEPPQCKPQLALLDCCGGCHYFFAAPSASSMSAFSSRSWALAEPVAGEAASWRFTERTRRLPAHWRRRGMA